MTIRCKSDWVKRITTFMDDGRIFNRNLLRKRRNRAGAQWTNHSFLKVEAASRIADSIADIKRTFPFALDLGCHMGEVGAVLGDSSRVIGCDLAERMYPEVVCDEEYLPFVSNTFDLVTSALSLHHVNDLPGAFIQICDILKPDGLFIAILPGASTLIELRNSVTGAAAQQGFAVSPIVSPFVEVRDAGALLQHTGFALPVVGSETLTVGYKSAFELMKDLQGMGESNVLLEQARGLTPRAHLASVCQYYEANYPNKEGGVNATFEFITITGWKPHSSQQQPAERGSGQVNLNQALG